MNTVQILLDQGIAVNMTARNYNPLTIAAKEGNEEIVRLLLQHGADVNQQHSGLDGETPLVAAASSKGRIGVLRLLLEQGAHIDSSQGRGSLTALQNASTAGDLEVVGFLLDCGADPNKSNSSSSALCNATSNGHLEIVDLLLSRGAVVQAEAVKLAISKGNIRIAEQLICKSAGYTLDRQILGHALEAAYCRGFNDIAQELIKRGAGINLQSGRAIQEIRCGDQEAMLSLLNGYGPNLDAYGKALKAASSSGNEQIARLLLDSLRKFNCDFQGTE